jgi:nucleotide-binding universal stress UspA family protein
MLALVIWGAIVVVTVVVMARRGHSWFTWFWLSAVLGPLCWPLAADTLVRDRRGGVKDVPRHGGLLIAVAPWVRSLEPLRGVMSNLTIRDAGATLVCVLDAEDATTVSGKETTRETERRLAAFAKTVKSWGFIEGPVDYRVEYGRPADVLSEIASKGGYAAIVLGPTGTLRHRVLHGSIPSRLRRRTSVPMISAPESEIAS